ncbi:nuclear factor erythroid 2-related factor 3 isoform X2 [Perognathus longimembris pacificus]|uniref:nuclear factor erythroid 2-related factor 3 isoform X2 n=1 Tax=Perognathus longimembris pacificus TaxID=214514 RepID=UPI00201942C8|nr:nuclear factor erythroid 2-related factor 3 isoform X2 [Perognathus longimembris pacificus]
MKLLKPWWAAGGGLLHITFLLSLTGFPVDLDLYLLLPPPAPLGDELLWLGRPTRSAHPLSPFPASGEWGRTGPQCPKGLASDPEAPLERQLLRKVRALGVPFIPRTRVDAWLVHGVAAGDTDGAHGLFGAASSAGGVGASVDSSNQAVPGGGGDSREALSSPLAAIEEEEEVEAAAEPTAQVPDAGGRAGQDTEVVLRQQSEAVDHNSQCEERVSAQKRKSLQQSNEDDSKIAAKPDWETEKTNESRNERHLNWTDTSFSLEDFFHLLSSQADYSLEEISLDIPPLPGNNSDGMNSSGYDHNVNFSQAVSHDVNLHEAMLLCSNNTFIRNVARTSQAPESFLQLNSHTNPEQTLSGSNFTGLFPLADNQMRNLTSQDLLYDLDENVLAEINSMSLATGFDPLEVSQLCEEPDSDSGLSLNSSHNSTCITKSNSSHSTYEGATGYSSDLEFQDLGAVGGCYPEPSKRRHMDHRNEHILHNHTYHLQPTAPEPMSESFRYLDNKGRNLSRDERRAKALHIPFSVDEIVRMPVDSFNSMLSRHYLTDLQVSLIRDIRRRGKNKVAAQNCRKRKLDIILNLEDDVSNLQAKKETLKRERTQCNKAIDIMKQKLQDLYHDVFSRLRDDHGRPVNPNQYTLQCSHDGAVLIVPKELVIPGHKKEAQKGKRNSERH